ncbi:MAG: fibronectin type III domain-containing protein, partial [Nitrospirae bacterium]|nr:fibronectin type III domain-containing protein [Nitrospirota bacterium]
MHLVKQRLFDTTLNPPPSTSTHGRLRGIFSILIVVVIFSVISIGATNSARAGQAVLTWDPPTTNSDGSPLTDLAGYKVYYGPTSGNYSTVINVANVTSYTVTGLYDNTTYYFATTAYNTSSIESAYSGEVAKTTTGTTDITAPVLSNITTGNITSSSAAITWTTNEQASSQIEYGTTTAYGSSTTIDNTLLTSHSVSLSGLSSWTPYHFRVKSRDAAGNLTTSGDYTFTTLAPPDTTPPTGTIAINNGDPYATSTSAAITFSCSDAGSGCSQMRSSNTGNVWQNYV